MKGVRILGFAVCVSVALAGGFGVASASEDGIVRSPAAQLLAATTLLPDDSPFAKQGTLEIVVGSVSGTPGSQVALPVELVTNGTEPSTIVFDLFYGADSLDFVSVMSGPIIEDAGKQVLHSVIADGRARFVVFDALKASQVIGDGTLMTLTFALSATASAGETLAIAGDGTENASTPQATAIVTDVIAGSISVNGEVTQYTLTTNTVGQGAVSLDPLGGIYDEETEVTLTATPDAGWEFAGWQGDLGDSQNPLTITLTSDVSVTAVFVEIKNLLHVDDVSGTQGAQVLVPLYLSRPCATQDEPSGDAPATIAARLEFDAAVLTPATTRWQSSARLDTWYAKTCTTNVTTPGQVRFVVSGLNARELTTFDNQRVGGNPSDQENPFLIGHIVFNVTGNAGQTSALTLTTVSMANGSAESVRSSVDNGLFTVGSVTNTYTLTVDVQGQGSVELDPPGGVYDEGSEVTLTATPDSGWVFDHWVGMTAVNENPTTITVDADQNVTAVFTEETTPGAENVLVVGDNAGEAGSTVAIPIYLFRPGTTKSLPTANAPAAITAQLEFDPAVLAPAGRYWASSQRLETWYGKTGLANGSQSGKIPFVVSGGTVIIGGQVMSTEITTYDDQRIGGNPSSQENPFLMGRILFTVIGGAGHTSPLTFTNISMANRNAEAISFGATSGVFTVGSSAVTYTLTTNIQGQGSVQLAPSGGTYEAGSEVTLTPIADSGWVFDHWEGDLCGSANPVVMTMSADKTVTAVFTRVFTLTTAVKGNGVVLPEAGPHTYRTGARVRLVAIAGNGWLFDHWEGDLDGSENPTTLVMDADKAVTAVFVEEPSPVTYILTTSARGPGIVVPFAGTHLFEEGTSVLLTAWPNRGARFDHWEGDVTGSQNPTRLPVTANKSVTAVFVATTEVDVTGVVTDRFSGLPLEGVSVALTEAFTNVPCGSTATEATGSFRIVAPSGKPLTIQFTCDGYDSYVLSGFFAPTVLSVRLNPDIPAAPNGLVGSSGPDNVRLRWRPNFEPDLAGYNVYRETAPKAFERLNDAPVPRPKFIDTTVTKGVEYTYYVTALDKSGNESAPSDSVRVVAGVIVLSLPDVSGEPGSVTRVPINCANATNIAPEGMDIWLTFDRSLVDYTLATPVWVERTALTSDVVFLCNASEPGIVKITAVGETDPLRGEGHLFDVYLTLSGDAPLNECGVNAFDRALFYDAAAQLLPVDASDTGFLCLASTCEEGDLNDDGVVNGADVILALQLAVGLLEPEGCRLEAGDINGDGRIDSGDALMIHRMVLGLPINPPQPGSKSSFGNEPPLSSLLKDTTSVTVELGQVEALPGESVSVPVLINDATGLSGLDITVSFPADQLQPAETPVMLSQLTDGFDSEIEIGDGYLTVSMSDPVALTGGQGELMTLRFVVADDAPSGLLPLAITHVDLKGQYGDSFTWYADIVNKSGGVTVKASPRPTDVNGDYTLNAVDVQLVINGALDLPVEQDCDVNRDDSVNAIDVQLVINAVLGV